MMKYYSASSLTLTMVKKRSYRFSLIPRDVLGNPLSEESQILATRGGNVFTASLVYHTVLWFFSLVFRCYHFPGRYLLLLLITLSQVLEEEDGGGIGPREVRGMGKGCLKSETVSYIP